MKSVTLFPLVWLLAASGSAAQSAPDLADRLSLIPAPKELSLQAVEQPLADWQIVAPADSHLIQVGVEEINQRITSLGGAPLPTETEPHLDKPTIFVGRWWDPNIRPLAMALGSSLTPADPGEQGYVIRFGQDRGRPVVLLGGSDEQGALYACITFRSLIHRRGGQVVFQPAAVRDWPDFKIRNNGLLALNLISEAPDTEHMQGAANAVKAQVDFYLRHKVNYVSVPLNRYPEASAQSSSGIDQQRRRLLIEVLHYARDRGIRTRFGGGADVYRYLTPEQRQTAVKRQPGTAFDWAALDAHRQNARSFAEFVSAARGAMFYLHPFDGGGYNDPERWSERGPATRAMYGNDRAWASLEQFMLYFDIIREAVPDIELEAVIYPYHYQFLTPEYTQRFKDLAHLIGMGGWIGPHTTVEEASEQQRSLTAYSRYLAQHLLKDVYVAFREADRDVFQAAVNLYGDRPLTLWIYPDQVRGWRGSFCPQVRFAKTYWAAGRRDFYYAAYEGNAFGDGRSEGLAAQEYLWNTDQPDGSDQFTLPSRNYEHADARITDFQRNHLIPRITRILYGEEAEAYRQLTEANISFAYVSDPESCARAESFKPVYKHMEEQAAAMERIHSVFSGLIEKTTEPWTPFYYRYTGLAGVKAALCANIERCRKLLDSGQPSVAAALARRNLAELPGLSAKCDAIRTKTETRLPQRIAALDQFRPEQFEVEFRKFIK